MLNIYRGSELTDREKFIFDHVKGSTLLLVPDQFSLQAERDAFFYLKEKSLMNVKVVDFSSLGAKAVRQTGGRQPELIDKYGRHMLLTRILGKCDEQLSVYRGKSAKNSFVSMLNSAVSELKRYDVSPEALREALGDIEDSSYLKYKIGDILKIYEMYQEAISGKYLDSEDYITFYGDRILEAPMVRESEIWIYGFDTFTPKNMQVIEKLIIASRGVNVVMTYEEGSDVFDLTGYVIKQLSETAEKAGHAVRISDMDGEKRKTVWDLVKSDEAPGANACVGGTAAGGGADGGDDVDKRGIQIDAEARVAEGMTAAPLTLAATSNMYAEAERAAAYVLDLVRNEGYRFGDIVIVCNDSDTRGGILRRTFVRWGIPVFMDKKRTVLHQQAVSFVLALTEAAVKGYRDEAVMSMIKSGMIGFADEDREKLENYVREFRIRGTMWKKTFSKGKERYSAEELEQLEAMRERVAGAVEGVKEKMGVRNTAGEKIRGLYSFLEADMDMIEKLGEETERQEEMGFVESAAETAQSWNVICGIFDQIVNICGDEKVSGEELLRLLRAGFEEVEIGLVPASPDCVMIGTLQRTRISRLKALMIVGANEGVLPLGKADEGLLSEREKEVLRSMDLEVSKMDETARKEEQIAIYRMLCLPQEHLYVSCCSVDPDGHEARPSEVFSRLKERYSGQPDDTDGSEDAEKSRRVSLIGDVDASGDFMERVTSKKGTLSHMAEALRAYRDGTDIDREWLQVLGWYDEKDSDDLRLIMRGMDFDNKIRALGDDFADSLYRGDAGELAVSASRLEQYSRCPFSHFVKYGLRAEEMRVYEAGAREIGDVYHRCLMEFSRGLTPDRRSGMTVDDPGSPWMTVSEEECRARVREIIERDAQRYREGLFTSGGEENYRTERISDICCRIAWAMVQQVRSGSVKSMAFEYPFGAGGALPPIEVEVGDFKVNIQGRIDRLDVLDGGAVRIVDYKTGSDKIEPEYFRKGYKLQLMVYLKAALGAAANGAEGAVKAEPAGVFYFRIKDVDMDGDREALPRSAGEFHDRIADAYRLEGIALNDETLINAMDREIDGASHVIPVKISRKDGGYASSAGGYLMSREEFDELCEQVDGQVERICAEICRGNVDIRPKREKKTDIEGNHRTACRYCGYRSICVFDTSFAGCGYEQI